MHRNRFSLIRIPNTTTGLGYAHNPTADESKKTMHTAGTKFHAVRVVWFLSRNSMSAVRAGEQHFNSRMAACTLALRFFAGRHGSILFGRTGLLPPPVFPRR